VIFELTNQIHISNTLGEGVVWNERTESIWWTDIEGRKLFSYFLPTSILETYDLPQRLGSFAMIEGSSSLLAAFETGLAIYNPKTKSIEWLEHIYAYGSGLRLNDGRVDRQGSFWFGGMVEEDAEHGAISTSANLFKYSSDKGLSVQETGIKISNSLCWSPDGKVMYFADSPKNEIYTYDISSETGEIQNKKVFATTSKGVHPDGSCVDSDGYLWNAQWGAGQVVRYAPDGQIDNVIEVPSSQPTCVSFGGPEMNCLFVTSARLDLTSDEKQKYPQSGDLFIYQTSVRGLKEERFKADL